MSDDYKQMVIDANDSDIVYTAKISGVNANFLRSSIERAGLDPDSLDGQGRTLHLKSESGHKQEGAWRDIWSAGQGVGSIRDRPTTGELIGQLRQQYLYALQQVQDQQRKYSLPQPIAAKP